MAQPFGYYKHAAANGNITGIQGSVLVGVTINSKGATGNILTIYDGADAGGIVIAIFDTTSVVGFIPFGAFATKGALFATLGTGTAADITIISY